MSDLVGTPKQVAERLECRLQDVVLLMESGRLRYFQLTPRKRRIPWLAVDEMLESGYRPEDATS